MANGDFLRSQAAQAGEAQNPQSIPTEGAPAETQTFSKHLRVILNPAAGQDEPALKVFNSIFREAGYGWDVRITQQAGDATRLAREAVDDGMDMVVVYGGDGSIMEAAAGMIGSDVPLGIVPGGTGNVISLALGIPRIFAEAVALLVSPERGIRSVDLGMAGEKCFMERLGVGLEATVTQSADREAKNKYGIFAYVISTVQALADPDIVTYRLKIDGEEIVTKGLSCVVANVGDLGVANLSLAPDVDFTDGLLDIFVIRKAGLINMFSLAASVIGGNDNHETMPHYKGREIEIIAEPAQAVHADGEVLGSSPVRVKVLPSALKVVVPPVDRKGNPVENSGTSAPNGAQEFTTL